MVKEVVTDLATNIHKYGDNKSRGVACLIKTTCHADVRNMHQNNGRFMLIEVQIDNDLYTIGNVYAPNLQSERNSFLRKF